MDANHVHILLSKTSDHEAEALSFGR